MAESIGQWQERLPGVLTEKIIEWINASSGKGFTKAQIESFMYDEYSVFQGRMTTQEFEQKWSAPGFDAALGKVANHMKISPAQKTLPATPETATRTKSMFTKNDTANDITDDTIDDIEEDEDMEDYISDSQELKSFNIIEAPEANKPTSSDPLPFNNPDLQQVIAEQQRLQEPEATTEEAPMDKIGKLKDYMQKSFPGAYAQKKQQDDFITATFTQEQYMTALKPYGTFLNRTKNEPMLLIDLARTIDIYNHPPYMQLRPIIINNGILDLNNTKVLLNVLDEEIPDRTIQRYIPLPDAWMMTRSLVEQNYLTSAMLNYDAIIEKILNTVIPALQANIVLLSIYCETKKQSPFEISIPRMQLASSIMEAFEDIKRIIQEQLVKELANLRTDLAGELFDVHTIVEKNFGKFDVQIRDAIEKVIWKVKTDVDATNKEDITRVFLNLDNRRTTTYRLGPRAVAIMTVMVGDYERMIIARDYKIDAVKETRRYTITEMQKKLNYTNQTHVTRGVLSLAEAKLIKLYPDKTFQLPK